MSVPKCPKCDGEMDVGVITIRIPGIAGRFVDIERLTAGLLREGDRVEARICRQCGYIEVYKKQQ